MGGTGELAWSLTSAGVVEELSGDLDAAESCHREALGVAAPSGDRAAMALALEGLAGVAVARGDAEQAALLLGAASAGRADGGFRFEGELVDVEGAIEKARDGLGERAFAKAFERGRALGLDAITQVTLPSGG